MKIEMIKLLELDKNQVIIIFAIIGLLTVIATLIVFLSTKEEETEEYIHPEIADIMGEENLTVSDFLLEKPGLLDFNSDYYLIRKQYEKWDWIQAEKYWVNIKSILIDILSRENDIEMEGLIKSIP